MANVPPLIKLRISVSWLIESLKWPVEKVTLGATDLIVNPKSIVATAALAEVTPGTISYSIP